MQQMQANLQILPRAPVFVITNKKHRVDAAGFPLL